MALDEAVLAAVGAGQVPATLRLYGWDEPWVSLGSGQAVGDLDRAACRALGLSIVRRASGGSAVHQQVAHLAYSLAVPADHPLAPPDVIESYRLVNRLLLAALAPLGVRARLLGVAEARAQARSLPPPLRAACLAAFSPYEIVLADGRKLVGSAQVRRGGGVLHHGVIPLRFDPAAAAAVLAADDRPALVAGLAATVSDLETATGRPWTVAEAAAALQAGLATAFGGQVEVAGLTPAEEAAAAEYLAARYGNPAWTFRR
jgi:lipoate-protein ligase A